MAKLENKIIKKLEGERRISHISAEKVGTIAIDDQKKGVNYSKLLKRRTNASYNLAGKPLI